MLHSSVCRRRICRHDVVKARDARRRRRRRLYSPPAKHGALFFIVLQNVSMRAVLARPSSLVKQVDRYVRTYIVQGGRRRKDEAYQLFYLLRDGSVAPRSKDCKMHAHLYAYDIADILYINPHWT